MKNGKLQVAVIGCGGIANQKHFPALTSQSDKCDTAPGMPRSMRITMSC